MKQFDLIIKESFQSVFLQSNQSWLGLDLSNAEVKEVERTLNRPTHREVDFLRHVTMPNGEEFLLHIEFQTEDYTNMHLRMSEYRAMLQSSHELPVRQYLIYLGQPPTKMRSRLSESYQIIEYTIISLNQFRVEDFLQSDSPDEIVFAILSNYSKKQAKQIVITVLERLKSLNLNKDELKKYINYLLTLGQLRKLQSVIKQQVQAMPITIDMTDSPIFQEGLEKGMEKTKKQDIIGLLKLGKFSIQDIAQGLDVSEQYIKEIKQSLDEK